MPHSSTKFEANQFSTFCIMLLTNTQTNTGESMTSMCNYLYIHKIHFKHKGSFFTESRLTYWLFSRAFNPTTQSSLVDDICSLVMELDLLIRDLSKHQLRRRKVIKSAMDEVSDTFWARRSIDSWQYISHKDRIIEKQQNMLLSLLYTLVQKQTGLKDSVTVLTKC